MSARRGSEELVRQLETENKISAEDEREGSGDRWTVLIKFMTGCAALHYTALKRGWGEHNKEAFPVRPRNKNSVWHRRRLTAQPQYPRFTTEHTTSAAISGTDLVSKLLAVSQAAWIGSRWPLCAAHDQTGYMRSKLTTDNSHFCDNVTLSHTHQCGGAVICKKAEIPWGSLYFWILFKLFYNCSFCL